MYRLIIADDHGLYRRGLRTALSTHFPGSEIEEAQCFDAVLNLLAEKSPIDLAIVDLHMPDLASLEVLTDVLPIYPQTRFMIISGMESRAAILATLSAGLHGFIGKSQTDDDLMQAVKDVLSGRIYVPPLLSQAPSQHALYQHMSVEWPSIGSSAEGENLASLTPRQLDVLKLMADGLSNKEIARDLEIAEATTKIHVGAVMRALGVRNRTEAAVLLNTWLTRNSLHRNGDPL
jgi:DNA-binding NarL/FixJ family response regulator